MLRAPLLALALLAATPAFAEPGRAHLPAVGGVAFGTTFAVAQATLGPGFKAATGPAGVRTLNGRGAFIGSSFDLVYVFSSSGRLSEIRAEAVMRSEELGACHERWDQALGGLIAQVGRPDRREESVGSRTQFATAGFDFADGGEIEALLAGCYLRLTFDRAPARLS
ncbi:hypothetical protein [Phenylobacterium aquaticum]|uniref:hypothetical protein n=1 Tax=Phenylobacterium aquaticum TaxID=1763816 RepID=UPI0026EBC1AA|nr:hypothetical protein [Phenylobacterium aquaticum]